MTACILGIFVLLVCEYRGWSPVKGLLYRHGTHGWHTGIYSSSRLQEYNNIRECNIIGGRGHSTRFWTVKNPVCINHGLGHKTDYHTTLLRFGWCENWSYKEWTPTFAGGRACIIKKSRTLSLCTRRVTHSIPSVIGLYKAIGFINKHSITITNRPLYLIHDY